MSACTCIARHTIAVTTLLPRSAEHQQLTAILYDYNEFSPNDELGRAQLALGDLQPGQEKEVTLLLRAKGKMLGVSGEHSPMAECCWVWLGKCLQQGREQESGDHAAAAARGVGRWNAKGNPRDLLAALALPLTCSDAGPILAAAQPNP